MPPRFTFWTIIIDGRPTAFRAAEREDLLPTLKQLQAKSPTAVMKWFARGRVWESPEEARRARSEEEASVRKAALEERRGREWRPGGQHKDPREKFKKETFQARKRREKKAENLAHEGGTAPSSRAEGPGFRGRAQDAGGDTPGARPASARNRGSERPWSDKRDRPRDTRGPSRPGGGDRGFSPASSRNRGGERPWSGKHDRPRDTRGPSRPGGGDRGFSPTNDRNRGGERPWSGKHDRPREGRPPAPPRTPTAPPQTPTAPPQTPPAPQRPAPEDPLQARTHNLPASPGRATPPVEPGPPAPAHETRLPRLRKP